MKNQVPAPVYRVALPREQVPGAAAPMPPQDFGDKVKRGFYLATIAHCMECHTPMAGGKHEFSQARQGRPRVSGAVGQIDLA